MMEKVTQMIAMLIKAWKKESVSQIDTPPVPATPEPTQQSPNNSACRNGSTPFCKLTMTSATTA